MVARASYDPRHGLPGGAAGLPPVAATAIRLRDGVRWAFVPDDQSSG